MSSKGIEVLGLEALEKQLKELPGYLAKGIIRKGLKAGCEIMRAKTEELAPERTGALKQSIKVTPCAKHKGYVGYCVSTGEKTLKGKDTLYKGDTFYGAFQEMGYHPHGGETKVEGKHFFQKAFEETHEAAAQKAIETIEASVEKRIGGGSAV